MIYGKIVGTGKYLPEKVLTNKELESIVDTTDEWISSRTGIQKRRIAVKEKSYDMAVYASQDALKSANIEAKDIDLIIVATMTSEYATPSVSCIVQKEIGADNAMAFDLSAACSGFLFALHTADQYIKTGTFKNILIVGCEKLSHIVNWEDRNTCVLFGDGAGAAVVSASNEPGIIATECKSVGKDFEFLTAKVKRIQTPFYEQEDTNYLFMKGREVFEFACTKVPASIELLLEKENISKEDISNYILHQANIRIIKKIARKLKEDINKFYVNIPEYGNTSAASVAIALDEMYKQKDLKGKKVVLAGFGAGLTYGASIVQF